MTFRVSHIFASVFVLAVLTAGSTMACDDADTFDWCIRLGDEVFAFNDDLGVNAATWIYIDCATGFSVCGVGTVKVKGDKIILKAKDDAKDIAAEVNSATARGKAKGKGISFTAIGGGFQIKDEDATDPCNCAH